MLKLIHKIKEVTNQMASLGKRLHDMRIVQVMPNVWPSSHKRFIQSMISQNEIPSVTKLTNKLLYEKQWFQNRKLKLTINITTHLGFCDWFKKWLLNFSIMFITTWSQKLLCSFKEHQNVTWHHGFVIMVNMTTCSIFG